MHPHIEEKEAFTAFGLEKPPGLSYAAFWSDCHRAGLYQKLFRDAGGVGDPDKEVLGVGLVNAMGNYEAMGDYMIFAFAREGCRTQGYKTVQVPASAWAVFRGREAKDPGKQVSGLFRQAYKEWLPRSGYVRAAGPDIEIYSITDSGKFRDEIRIPIMKT